MSEDIRMNIDKADYSIIVKMGTLNDLKKKLEKDSKNIMDIVNILDYNGVSLLEKSIVGRKFEISKYLLENNASVNVITKTGYNEFHLLAPNINSENAIEIANILKEKGTSLMQRDYKYGNTAFFSLCSEAFKKRLEQPMNFVEQCFVNVSNVDEKNNNGFSIRDLITERGSQNLKRMLEVLE